MMKKVFIYRTHAGQTEINAVQADIDAIRAKIQDKAKDLDITTGPGTCRAQGVDRVSAQGKGCNDQKPCGKQVARGCGNIMGRCAQ